jgi:hypothetical protein
MDLLARADLAMYQAKQAGKDQVAAWAPPTATEDPTTWLRITQRPSPHPVGNREPR